MLVVLDRAFNEKGGGDAMTDAQEAARVALRSALERYDKLTPEKDLWHLHSPTIKALAEAVRASLKEIEQCQKKI